MHEVFLKPETTKKGSDTNCPDCLVPVGGVGVNIIFLSTMVTTLKQNLNLNAEQLAWINDETNINSVTAIYTYLQKNRDPNGNYYPEAINFAKEAVEALRNGADVDFVNTIINKLTGKADCINNNLRKKGNDFVKDIFKNFKGKSEFNIIIKSVDKIFSEKRNQYVNGQTTYKRGGTLINISISTDKLSNLPALGAARTILHEYIHAEMFRKLNTKNTTEEILDFRKTYEQYENGSFVATPQHETMAELYVISMRDALKKFHKDVLVDDYNYLTDNGNNPLPDDFYEALAWQGLKNNGVKAYNDLSATKKEALKNALELYYPSTTKNCPK